MLFAPGNDLKLLFTACAELWDVRNGFLYLGAEAESEVHQTRATAWIDRREAVEQARDEALGLLGAELRQRFDNLHRGAASK